VVRMVFSICMSICGMKIGIISSYFFWPRFSNVCDTYFDISIIARCVLLDFKDIMFMFRNVHGLIGSKCETCRGDTPR
jgi:hypothetical protein